MVSKFDSIYDTKYIANEEKNINKYLADLKHTSLKELCDFLKQFLLFFNDRKQNDFDFPNISSLISSENYHNAGYDSYVSAQIYIYLCHIISHDIMKSIDNKIYFNHYLSNVKKHANKLCISISSKLMVYIFSLNDKNLEGKEGVVNQSQINQTKIELSCCSLQEKIVVNLFVKIKHILYDCKCKVEQQQNGYIITGD
ncbi:LOW QUALITY PROTEIN: hypothetical protein MXB_3106, partial [Myxobolus squamalis]